MHLIRGMDKPRLMQGKSHWQSLDEMNNGSDAATRN